MTLNFKFKKTEDESNLIYYESLISLSLVTENKVAKKNHFLLMRSSTLEEGLILNKCNINADIDSIKESLFAIKMITEKESNKIEDDQSNLSVLLEYNRQFHLEHFISKKYLVIKKNNTTSTYDLRLTKVKEKATSFFFKKIVDQKSTTSSFISYNQIIFLSSYIQERNQYYFLNIQSSGHNQNAGGLLEKDIDESKQILRNLHFALESFKQVFDTQPKSSTRI